MELKGGIRFAGSIDDLPPQQPIESRLEDKAACVGKGVKIHDGKRGKRMDALPVKSEHDSGLQRIGAGKFTSLDQPGQIQRADVRIWRVHRTFPHRHQPPAMITDQEIL